MELIIYADFNSPTCHLASQRADRLLDRGAVVHWRAVEHAPYLPLLGASDAAERDERMRELVEAAGLALPGEYLPSTVPPAATNTRAAIAAYAEAVGDGVADEIRRRLFHAIWAQRRHLSSAHEVRRIITDVMDPRVPTGPRRAANLARPLTGEPDQWRVITADGGPPTTTARRRVHAWRDQWRVLACPPLPLVIDPDGDLHHGPKALALLADLSCAASAPAAALQIRRRSVVSPAA